MALDEDGYVLPSDWYAHKPPPPKCVKAHQKHLILATRYMRICGLAAESLRGDRLFSDAFPLKELQDYWDTRPKYEYRSLDSPSSMSPILASTALSFQHSPGNEEQIWARPADVQKSLILDNSLMCSAESSHSRSRDRPDPTPSLPLTAQYTDQPGDPNSTGPSPTLTTTDNAHLTPFTPPSSTQDTTWQNSQPTEGLPDAYPPGQTFFANSHIPKPPTAALLQPTSTLTSATTRAEYKTPLFHSNARPPHAHRHDNPSSPLDLEPEPSLVAASSFWMITVAIFLLFTVRLTHVMRKRRSLWKRVV